VLIHGDRHRPLQRGFRQRQRERHRLRSGLHRPTLRVAGEMALGVVLTPFRRLPRTAHDRRQRAVLRLRLDGGDRIRRRRRPRACSFIASTSSAIGSVERTVMRSASAMSPRSIGGCALASSASMTSPAVCRTRFAASLSPPSRADR
jgi:hypothetical protein